MGAVDKRVTKNHGFSAKAYDFPWFFYVVKDKVMWTDRRKRGYPTYFPLCVNFWRRDGGHCHCAGRRRKGGRPGILKACRKNSVIWPD